MVLFFRVCVVRAAERDMGDEAAGGREGGVVFFERSRDGKQCPGCVDARSRVRGKRGEKGYGVAGRQSVVRDRIKRVNGFVCDRMERLGPGHGWRSSR